MYDKLNEHIKSYKAEKHQIDKEDFWRELESKLPNKKKKRTLIWVLPMLFLTFLSSYFLFAEHLEKFEFENSQVSPSKAPETMERIPNNMHSSFTIKKTLGESPNIIPVKRKTIKSNALSYNSIKRSISFQNETHQEAKSTTTEKVKASKTLNIEKVSKQLEVLNRIDSKLQFENTSPPTIFLPKNTRSVLIKPAKKSIDSPWTLVGSMNLISFQNIIDSSGFITRPELQQLEKSTDPMFGVSTEVQIGYRIHNKLRINLGLGFMQLNEKFTFETDSISTVNIQTSQGIATVVDLIERKVRHTNHFKYLQVPLSLSYRKAMHGLSLDLGINYSHLFDFDGIIYLQNEKLISYSNAKEVEHLYKRNNWNVNFAIHYSIPMSSTLDFVLNLEHQREIFGNNSLWNQKRRLNMLGFSMVYKF